MITVRISFEKKNEASYISLLDLQRVMQRVLKRSGRLKILQHKILFILVDLHHRIPFFL